MELYQSRLAEMKEKFGEYKEINAAVDYYRHLIAVKTDYMLELSYADRKRIHNLKYYTWIEQQGKELAELNAQWYDYEHYWGGIHRQTEQIDRLINEFNERTGLLKNL